MFVLFLLNVKKGILIDHVQPGKPSIYPLIKAHLN